MDHPVTWTGLLGVPDRWQSVVTSGVVMLVLLLAAARARSALARGFTVHPDGTLTARNIFELLVESIASLAESIIGPHSGKYVPILASFFLLILACNLMGLLPGFSPPTGDSDMTFALGAVSFLVFNYYGFKTQGMDYLKHFAGPFWWLAFLIFPLEIIGVLVRPFSLGLRLYGNLFGDHLVLEIFTGLTKVVIPVVFYMLGTLVSVIQAFVFMLLSMIYIALSVSHQGEGAH